MVLRLHQHNIGYTADGFYRFCCICFAVFCLVCFPADHTNGRAYATVLCPSVVSHCQYVAYCASYRKTEEANRIWPIGNRM